MPQRANGVVSRELLATTLRVRSHNGALNLTRDAHKIQGPLVQNGDPVRFFALPFRLKATKTHQPLENIRAVN